MKAFISIIVLGVAITIRLIIWPPLRDLLEIENCPECYGTSLCHAFAAGHISRDVSSIDAIMFNLIGTRHIKRGIYINQKVVLKKLSSPNELIEKHKGFISQPFNKTFHLCPSLAHIERLHNMYEKQETSRPSWTLISQNPEPLILQILKEEEGWPTAKFLGACGSVIVEEYVGEMLYTYHSAPWLQRAQFAYQLLTAALNFTNSHPEFSFYLTDISGDNIAVGSDGRIKFIDLDDVIVVDKAPPEQDRPASWDEHHVSEEFECEGAGCFAFSPEDICSHSSSDHNVYAVCYTLLHPKTASSTLPGGLLHDPPEQHKHVLKLVETCTFSQSRIAASQKLMSVLLNVLITASP